MKPGSSALWETVLIWEKTVCSIVFLLHCLLNLWRGENVTGSILIHELTNMILQLRSFVWRAGMSIHCQSALSNLLRGCIGETCYGGCIGDTGAPTNPRSRSSKWQVPQIPTLTQTIEHACFALFQQTQQKSNSAVEDGFTGWVHIGIGHSGGDQVWLFHPQVRPGGFLSWFHSLGILTLIGFSDLLWSSCSRLLSSSSRQNFKAFARSLHSTRWPGDFL